MKCITCEADIPPSFVHAIQTNTCAGCGGPIMDEVARELLVELKEAMTKMPNDPEGLAGWLLSNYNLTKVGSGEPVGFHRKPSAMRSEKELKIADNPMQKYLKRTGVSRALEERKDYHALANQINRGEVDDSMYGSEEMEQAESAEDMESQSEENDPFTEEAKYNLHQSSRMIAARKKQLSNANILLPGAQSSRPVSMDEMQDLSQKLSGRGPDFDKVQALNEVRLKKLQIQEEVAMGGAAGLIRRRG